MTKTKKILLQGAFLLEWPEMPLATTTTITITTTKNRKAS